MSQQPLINIYVFQDCHSCSHLTETIWTNINLRSLTNRMKRNGNRAGEVRDKLLGSGMSATMASCCQTSQEKAKKKKSHARAS